MKTRKLLFLCILILVAAALAGCACEHEWAASTCLAPRTCVRCGEVQGKVRSHTWGNTSCNAPEPCTVCGTMEGIELTHEWQEDGKICIHCGYDERPADERFPDALAAGLEQRWQLEETLQENEEYVLTKEDWAACFAAEYDPLIPFLEEKFQDKAMEEAAGRYIRSLEDSQQALEHFGTEQWEDAYYNSAYQEQTVALVYVNKLRPVTVSENYAQICAFAYRQTIAAHKLTYHDGEIQFLSKENFSRYDSR